MFIDNYALYLLVATGYIASPGPAIFIAINGGATNGIKNTAAVLLGNTIGLGVLAPVSALGQGVELASDRLTSIVKTAGGNMVGVSRHKDDIRQSVQRSGLQH